MRRHYLKGYIDGRLQERERFYTTIDTVLVDLSESLEKNEMTSEAYKLMELAVLMMEQAYSRRAEPTRRT